MGSQAQVLAARDTWRTPRQKPDDKMGPANSRCPGGCPEGEELAGQAGWRHGREEGEREGRSVLVSTDTNPLLPKPLCPSFLEQAHIKHAPLWAGISESDLVLSLKTLRISQRNPIQARFL